MCGASCLSIGSTWFDTLAKRTTPLWQCMPRIGGYNRMWELAHGMLVFIVSSLSSVVPSWAFGDKHGCDELGEELTFVSTEFRLLMKFLSPKRKTPSGRDVTWHVISSHGTFDHLVPKFTSAYAPWRHTRDVCKSSADLCVWSRPQLQVGAAAGVLSPFGA
jgi:hypothetical protein